MSLNIYYTDNYTGGRPESRRLLRAALSLHTGADPGDLEILTEDGGKPYVNGGPHFSVTHSGQYWAVLIADTPCGADIQLYREADHLRIAKRIFSEREADLVAELGSGMFFKIWTRREALVKSAGKSVFTDELPELLVPPGEDVIRVSFEGETRAVMDLDLPGMYSAVAWTVDGEWKARKEVPMMKRLDI